VVNVVDGDTIDVVVDGVETCVRYIGMDTPECIAGSSGSVLRPALQTPS
jgi:endonuclease YncB( thermonuclease family)